MTSKLKLTVNRFNFKNMAGVSTWEVASNKKKSSSASLPLKGKNPKSFIAGMPRIEPNGQYRIRSMSMALRRQYVALTDKLL